MIRHILEKDWKLQWKFATLMAVVQFASAAVITKLGPFMDNRALRSLLPLLLVVTLAGIPFLIAAVVHTDAIPGERQDWLVRPIRRRDLLLAKFIFVLIIVHGPMLLADLLRGLATGFPFGASLATAISHGLIVLLCFSLPLLAFVSLTRNFIEAIVGGLAVFVIFIGFLFLVDQTSSRSALVAASGLSWIQLAGQSLIGVVMAAAILRLQYFRRRTLFARGVAAAGALLAALTVFIPWDSAFALERRMSPARGAASGVNVSFDPMQPQQSRFTSNGGDSATLYLPLKFDNVPDGSALISDRAEVFLKDGSGASTRIGYGMPISLRPEGPHWGLQTSGPQLHDLMRVNVAAAIYRRVQDEHGLIEVHLSLTLLKKTGSFTVPAVGGDARIPDMGHCKTDVNAAETAVRLGCVALEEEPSCLALQLQDPASGARNLASFECQGDYAPYYDELFFMPRGPWFVNFNDMGDTNYLVHPFPVDGSKLGEAQLLIEPYQPADHFSRSVLIPALSLRNWVWK